MAKRRKWTTGKNFLHDLEAGEELADNKGGGADDVECDDDQGQLDSLDLSSGDDHGGGSKMQCQRETKPNDVQSNE